MRKGTIILDLSAVLLLLIESKSASPCLPYQGGCSLSCSNGYMTGPTGCYFCSCASGGQMSHGSMGNTLLSSNGGSQTGTNPAGNPLMQQQIAHAQCLSSSTGCGMCKSVLFHIGMPCYYCDCSQNATQMPTNIVKTTITHTSLPPTTTKAAPTVPQTTTKHIATSLPVIVLTTQHTPSPTTTGDYCTVALKLCSLSCPKGYLVDPSDCTYCVCKSDIKG